DDGTSPPANRRSSFELYDLTATSGLNPLAIDFAATNLLCTERFLGNGATCLDGSACDDSQPTSCLDANQTNNLEALEQELDRLLDSEPPCVGDGNLDRRVDQRDADGVTTFAAAISPLTGELGGRSFFD